MITEEEARELVVEVVMDAFKEASSGRIHYPEVTEADDELYITAEFWDNDGEQEVYASLKVELI